MVVNLKNMNKDTFAVHRNKTLLVVEGKHEKSSLLQIVLKCFPEIPINYENIVVYGADIYDLYKDIEQEYGKKWYEDKLLEIDIPYIISEKLKLGVKMERNRFTNIILIFDYERHDPCFDFQKICRMQMHFISASEDGMLYLNYPMIESYLDMDTIPCKDYGNKKLSMGMKSGYTYKYPIYTKSILWKYMKLYDNVRKDIKLKLPEISDANREELLNSILEISDDKEIENALICHIGKYSDNKEIIRFLVKSIGAKLVSLGFLNEKISYWDKMRWMLTYVVNENIRKAWTIQFTKKKISQEMERKLYDELDFTDILTKQNEASLDSQNGFIWILNTCMMFCGEYKFFWK